MKILILLLLISCGKAKKDCMSGEEKKLRCQADAVSRWTPASTPEWEFDQCAALYPGKYGCY